MIRVTIVVNAYSALYMVGRNMKFDAIIRQPKINYKILQV